MERKAKIDNLISSKKNELKKIKEQLELLRDDIESGRATDSRSKTKIKFTNHGKKYLKAAMALSRSKEQVEDSILDLENQADQLDYTISHIMEISENVEALKGDQDMSGLLDELGNEILVLEETMTENTKQISKLTKLSDMLTNAIEGTVGLLNDLISKFEKKFSNVPRDIYSQEWIDFLSRNLTS